MYTGKPVNFYCIWCEKEVKGVLIRTIIDYEKNKTQDEYAHDECLYRITTTIKSEVSIKKTEVT